MKRHTVPFGLLQVVPIVGILGVSIYQPQSIQAQILPDTTLDTENSVLTPDVNVRGAVADRIDGGATRGGNLFHSFSEFNVDDFQRVYFANPAGIENILSRVTGDDVSDIMGTLGVDGNANLFFLNPNGIIFGENARLDIAGSFVASTGDRFEFADGSTFSAVNPEAPPLLTVAIAPGLQYGRPVGANGHPPLPPDGGTITNQGILTVGAGQDLVLSGDTLIHQGTVQSPGGTVQLLGSDIRLLDGAVVDVSTTEGGGNVNIGGDRRGMGILPTANTVRIDPDVRIHADALAQGNGGDIIVWADDTTEFYGAATARGGTAGGHGGFIEISGRQALAFDGTVDLRAPFGELGTLLLDPENILITPDGFMANDDELDDGSVNEGDRPGEDLRLSIGAINATLANGNVVLEATNDITLEGASQLGGQGIPGDLTITADADNDAVGSFVMEPGSFILTDGAIAISGATVDLGGGITSFGDSITVIAEGDIRSEEGASLDSLSINFDGDISGDIEIRSNRGSIQLGGISTLSGDNSSGRITLQASEAVNVGDVLSNSAVDEVSNGNSGEIRITSDRGSITAGSVRSISEANGTGGMIMLTAQGDIVTDDVATDVAPIQMTSRSGNISTGAIQSFPISTPGFSSNNPGGDGGTITLNGAGTVTTGDIDTRSLVNRAGNVSIRAGAAIDIGDVTTISDGANFIGAGAIAEGGNVQLDAGTTLTVSTINTHADSGSGSIQLDAGDDIQFGSLIANSVERSGTITVRSGGMISSQNSIVTTDVTGSSQPGGTITLQGRSVFLTEGAQVSASTSGLSAGGTITIRADATLEIRGSSIPDEEGFATNPADELRFIEPATGGFIPAAGLAQQLGGTRFPSGVFTQTLGGGQAGNLQLAARTLRLNDGAAIAATTFGRGNGGTISIDVQETMTVDNSTILSGVAPGATGNSGDITLQGRSLSLSNGGRVQTLTRGVGRAGTIRAQFEDRIDISGIGRLQAANLFPSVIGSEVVDAGQLSTTALVLDGDGQPSGTPLTTIVGTLSTPNDIDLYQIFITDEEEFSASTVGSSQVNTILYLFDLNGEGLVSNDDAREFTSEQFPIAQVVSLQSNLPPTSLTPTDPGLYLVGVSASGISPVSFDFGVDPPTLVFQEGSEGADPVFEGGIGVNFPTGAVLDDWEGTGQDSGAYAIQLTGAEFTRSTEPEPPTLNLEGIDQISPSGFFSSSEEGAAGRGGQIQVSTDLLSVTEGAVLSARTRSAAAGGNITVDTRRARLASGGQLLTTSTGAGNAGNITVRASEQVTIAGADPTFESRSALVGDRLGAEQADLILENDGPSSGLLTRAQDSGGAGEITVNTPHLSMARGGTISAETSGTNQAGDILIQPFSTEETLQISIQDPESQISGSTSGSGFGGNLTLSAPESIEVQGDGVLRVETSGAGDAGNVLLETAQLTLRNGVEVSTTTEGTGTGGDIFVTGINDTRADQVRIIGAELSAETDGTSRAGDIQIRTRELVMRNDAEVTTSTNNAGDGGDIHIDAVDQTRLVNSTILAESNPIDDETGDRLTSTPGDAGRIQITTPQLRLLDNSQVSASNISSSSEGVQLQGLERLVVRGSSQILASTDTGSAGDIEVNAQGGRIRLSGADTRLAAEATGAGGRAGDVRVRADRLIVKDGAQINISTTDGEGGDIRLTLSNLSILNGLILAETQNGVAGELTLNRRQNPADRVVLSGVLNDGTPAGLSVEASDDEGEAGTLRLFTRDLIVRDGADLSAETVRGNVDNAGNTIRITGLESLILDNARISASTQRTGFAGGVLIDTSESVQLRGVWVDQNDNPVIDDNGNPLVGEDGQPLPAGVFVEGRGEGIARPLRIRTRQLVLDNRAQASVSTEDGRGGDLIVRAEDFVRLGNESELRAEATGNGDAGRVFIQTPSLTLQEGGSITASNVSTVSEGIELRGIDQLRVIDSEVTASTGIGAAGSLTVNLDQAPADLILVSGENSRLAVEATGNEQSQITRNRRTQISASDGTAHSEGLGTAGDMLLNTQELIVENGGIVTVSSTIGQAGTLTVRSPLIQLDNGQLVAETAFTAPNVEGAEITLDGLALFLLENGSLISADASGDADGGNITINANGGFVVASPLLSNSDIIATAEDGTGGNITIFATQIFGLTESLETRDQVRRTPTNDISASSEFGADGVISVEDVGVDPSRGLGELPIALVDAPPLDAVCSANREGRSEFVNTGRGGVQADPTDVLSNASQPTPWVTRDAAIAPVSSVNPEDGDSSNSTSIIEAQGWATDAAGNVVLFAAGQATPQPSGQPVQGPCHS